MSEKWRTHDIDEAYEIREVTPLGFMQHVEKSTVLRPYKKHIDLVRKIFQLCISGRSLGQITEYVNQQNVTYRAKYKKETEVKWSMAEVKKILQNEVYVSETYRVISKREFAIAQKMLTINTRVTDGKIEISPLIGIARCAECGSLMVERSTSSRGRKYCYYMCGTNKRKGGCTPHKVSVNELDDSVFKWLKNHVFAEEVQTADGLTRKLAIQYVDCVYVDEYGMMERIIIA